MSCEVSPIIGEYERTATTVLNSYLAPKVASYLDRIESLLRDRGFRGKFNVLNSAGGVVPAREAARKPVLLVASGPAGGVMGSLQLAQEIGHRNVITTDMGGTSFDVALVVDGKPLVSGTHEVGGFHLNTPVIDIRAIGAGGGSIARVEAGLLRVGPDSAGAMPGPICYGRGGTLATVTDADLVLGILSPGQLSRRPYEARSRRRNRRNPRANRQTARHERGSGRGWHSPCRRRTHGRHAARSHVGRGHDPRDFVLLAYGGAGPAHCIGYGAELGVPRILIPATSMAHSAYGALASDIQQSAERSLVLRAGGGTRDPWDGLDCDAINAVFAELQERCIAAMEESGFARAQSELARSIDMRYRRQTHDLMVPVPDGPITPADRTEAGRVVRGFLRGGVRQRRRLSYCRHRTDDVPRGRGRTHPQTIDPQAERDRGPETRNAAASSNRRRMAWTEAAMFQWLEMPVGFRVAGPAVVEHPETTVYVGPGQTARLDDAGNLTIDLT